MTYVARLKNDVMKGRDNRARDAYSEATLACGHEAHGAPTLTNPVRYWCDTCRAFSGVKSARKKAA